MATFEITAPNGKTLEIEGDTPPSEQELDEIFAQTNTNTDSTQSSNTEPTRPRGNALTNFGKGLLEGYLSIGEKMGRGVVNNKLRPLLGKQPLTDEQLDQAYSFMPRGEGISGSLGKFTGEIAPAFLIPETKFAELPSVANSAINGAIQLGTLGGLNSFAETGNPLPGMVKGGLGGAAFSGALSTAPKILPFLAEKYATGVARIQPETLKQVIKPNSKALDYTTDQAKNLLYNTTERVRNAYNNILQNAGQKVNDAIGNLRNSDTRINLNDLENDITNTFDKYTGENINPARNMTGSLEQDLKDLVNQGTGNAQDELRQALLTVKNSGNDYTSQLQKEEAYDILSKATGKDVNWLKSQLESTSNKTGMGKRRETIEMMLDNVDDKLDLAKNSNAGTEYRYYNNGNLGYGAQGTTSDGVGNGYDLARQAYDDIVNNNFGVPNDPLQVAINSAEQDYRHILSEIIDNPKNQELYEQSLDKLTNSVKYLPEEIQAEFAERLVNDTNNIYNKTNTISPLDLQKAKQQIGHMVNWSDETARNYKNPILEQIYGKFTNKLSDLSPELKNANNVFAKLKSFQKNEGLNSILRPGNNIDAASSKLKNYNSTVTKGNTGRNVKELEQVLTDNGYEPFLNDIDDINATMDLNNIRTTGDSAKANFGALLARPFLKLARGYNRTNIPTLLDKIRPITNAVSIPTLYGVVKQFENPELEPVMLDEYGQNIYGN